MRARTRLSSLGTAILACVAVAHAANARKAKSGKAKAAATLVAADRACTKDFARGNLVSTQRRCADLEPADSPVATYWRLALSDDPVELRKGLSAVALKGIDAEPRLLLLAGRYQFSRGEIRELSDLVWLCAKRKLKGPDIDTLRRLSAGK
jgi:hypothetical protein